MLRVPEDGGALRRSVEEAEAWAREAASSLAGFLAGVEAPLIAYTGQGYVASTVLYWGLTILSEKTPLHLDGEAVAYHLAPYREGLRIAVFSAAGTENTLFRLLDTARLTGHRLLLVSPKPPENLGYKVEHHQHLEVPLGLDPLLAEALLALKTAVRLSARPGSMRSSRLRVEADDIAGAVPELLEIYGGKLRELAEILGGGDVAVVYTPLMEAPALLLRDLAEPQGLRVRLYKLQSVAHRPPPARGIVALTTSVEGFIVRELRMRALQVGSSVEELEIRTDPVSAQVYGIILVEALSTLLRR